MSQSRQLAAIMFTDIVGYTALMGSDEQKAYTTLIENRELQKPIIDQHNGRWIKELGDGVMASFNTVSDAVNAAVKIQESCKAEKKFQLRIGIHLGEVIFENDDVFGDGVNIASRIQSAAKPGSIYISESVHQNVSNKKHISTKFIKEDTLKNVIEPVRMYEVIIENDERRPVESEFKNKLTTQNSIAVLPFVNMSNDRDQDYFCDGLTEEILNVLAQQKGLMVSARTSSFSFKGKDVDIMEIGNKLKVENVLEGSVRRSGDKLRVTAQLIKVADGFHLWSDRYDRQIADVFDIQDEISRSILEALKITLLSDKETSLVPVRTDNQEAYMLTLQGRFHFNKANPEGWLKSVEYFDQAINADPLYAPAYGGKSVSIYYLSLYYVVSYKSWSKVLEAAETCLTLDKRNTDGLLGLASYKFWFEWKFFEAEASFKKVIDLNPNDAHCLASYSMLLALCGKNQEAESNADKAIQLDPLSIMVRFITGWTFFLSNNLSRMHDQGLKIMELDPYSLVGIEFLAFHSWLNSDYEEAISILENIAARNVSVVFAWLGCLYGITCQHEKALDVIERLDKLSNQQYVGAYNKGLIYLGMGNRDEAFKWLNAGVEQHDGMLFFLKQKFRMLPGLKKDARMDEIIAQLGLP